MTAHLYIIAWSQEAAERQAILIERGDIPAIYLTRAEADRSLANYPLGTGIRYAVYEIPRRSIADRIGEAVAIPSLMLCGWLVWLILPGPAWASFEQRHAPVSAWDFWSIWIGMGIFIAAAVIGLGAFLANAIRPRINHDFTGEHTNGND